MTTEAAPAAASEPLSIDAALGLLDAAPEPVEREEDQPASADTTPEAESTATDEIDPEEAIDFGDDEAIEDPADAASPMPKSWAAEDAEIWNDLTPKAQAKVLARETERDKSTQKAVQEASEARKAADQTIEGVTKLKAATEQVLNRASEIFKGKWDNVDWAAWAQSDPAAYIAAKAQFETEQAELTRLQTVNQQQANEALRAFQATKAERIKAEAPDLVDPVKGPERVLKLEKFLETNGISRDIFHTLDAFTIGLANDGMKYREAKARAKANPTPAPTRATPRPGAAAPVRSQQRAAQEADNRFRQTRSIEDALAAMNARK